MLSAAMRLVAEGLVPLPRVLEAMTSPRRGFWVFRWAAYAAGAPADVVVFDPDEPWVCDPDLMKGRSKNTPFDGARMTGRVRTTIVGGGSCIGPEEPALLDVMRRATVRNPALFRFRIAMPRLGETIDGAP